LALHWFDLCQAEVAGFWQGGYVVLTLLIPATLPLPTGLAGKNGTFYNYNFVGKYLFDPGQVTIATGNAVFELVAGRKNHYAVRLRGVYHRQFGYPAPLLQSDTIQRCPLTGMTSNRQDESPSLPSHFPCQPNAVATAYNAQRVRRLSEDFRTGRLLRGIPGAQ